MQSPTPKRAKPTSWMLILAAMCILRACSVFCGLPSWPEGRSLQSRIPQRVRRAPQKKVVRAKKLVGQDAGTVAKQKALTAEINQCTSVSRLLKLVEGSDLKIDELNGICLSDFITMIGRWRHNGMDAQSSVQSLWAIAWRNHFPEISKSFPPESLRSNRGEHPHSPCGQVHMDYAGVRLYLIAKNPEERVSIFPGNDFSWGAIQLGRPGLKRCIMVNCTIAQFCKPPRRAATFRRWRYSRDTWRLSGLAPIGWQTCRLYIYIYLWFT